MENKLMRASEVAKELDVSLSYAYRLIKQLNEELRQKGYLRCGEEILRSFFNEQNGKQNYDDYEFIRHRSRNGRRCFEKDVET